MTQPRLKLLFAFNEWVRNQYLPAEELARLETFADWDWFPCQGGGIYDTNDDPEAAEALRQVGDIDGLCSVTVRRQSAKQSWMLLPIALSAKWRDPLLNASIWKPPGKGSRIDTTNSSSYRLPMGVGAF